MDNIISTCNVGCDCTTATFDPICGSDSVTYFSPCHAGCITNITDVSIVYLHWKVSQKTKDDCRGMEAWVERNK